MMARGRLTLSTPGSGARSKNVTKTTPASVKKKMKIEVKKVASLVIEGKLPNKEIFKANVNLTETSTDVQAYVSYFMMKNGAKGKGLCSTAFAELLKTLKTQFNATIVTLFVGSATPEKACKCYIKGGKAAGFYVIDEANMIKSCENGSNFMFVTSKEVKNKYENALKAFRKNIDLEKLPKIPKLIQNYLQTEDD